MAGGGAASNTDDVDDAEAEKFEGDDGRPVLGDVRICAPVALAICCCPQETIAFTAAVEAAVEASSETSVGDDVANPIAATSASLSNVVDGGDDVRNDGERRGCVWGSGWPPLLSPDVEASSDALVASHTSVR